MFVAGSVSTLFIFFFFICKQLNGHVPLHGVTGHVLISCFDNFPRHSKEFAFFDVHVNVKNEEQISCWPNCLWVSE